jgi:ankyrin repeat protein
MMVIRSFILLLLVSCYYSVEAAQVVEEMPSMPLKSVADRLETALWDRDRVKVAELLQVTMDGTLDQLLNPYCDGGGRTPLHTALERRCPDELIEMLLKAGSRIDIKIDGLHATAMRLALSDRDNDGCIKLCLKYAGKQVINGMDSTPSDKRSDCQWLAYFQFYLPVLTADKALRAQSSEYVSIVRQLSDFGYSALHMAARGGYDIISCRLYAYGADIEQRVENESTDTGATALFLAAQGGHLEVVRLLIGLGADMNACLPDGTTALMVAAQKGHGAVVRELINAGATREARSDGKTALALATEMQCACTRHLDKKNYGSIVSALVSGPEGAYSPLDCSELIAERTEEQTSEHA